MNVAVIGAGLSGLWLARLLSARYRVTVFEKSRGVSGRSSTRYTESHEFDHGAQYFTLRSNAIKTALKSYMDQGVIMEWRPRLASLNGQSLSLTPYHLDRQIYVGAPRMNAFAKALAEGLDVRLGVRVAKIASHSGEHTLLDDEGAELGRFNLVILAIPAAQAADLLPKNHSFISDLRKVRMTGCYTIMLGGERAIDLGYDGARISDSPLGWIAANHTKPGRNPNKTTLVVQSTNSWAEAHIDEDIPTMQGVLMAELTRLTGLKEADFSYITTHRWRYADTAQPLDKKSLFDEKSGLGLCGDWCVGGRVEAALESADDLFQKITQT